MKSHGNHVRYQHQRRPTRIDVVCPNCGARAIALDKIADKAAVFVGDMSPSWEGTPFEVRCTKCSHVSGQLSYFDLPAPFHQIYLYGEKLWAWNLQHLGMIYVYLQNGDISKNEYRGFATYIHGKWKKMRLKFSREIEKHLDQHGLSLDADKAA